MRYNPDRRRHIGPAAMPDDLRARTQAASSAARLADRLSVAGQVEDALVRLTRAVAGERRRAGIAATRVAATAVAATGVAAAKRGGGRP